MPASPNPKNMPKRNMRSVPRAPRVNAAPVVIKWLREHPGYPFYYKDLALEIGLPVSSVYGALRGTAAMILGDDLERKHSPKGWYVYNGPGAAPEVTDEAIAEVAETAVSQVVAASAGPVFHVIPGKSTDGATLLRDDNGDFWRATKL